MIGSGMIGSGAIALVPAASGVPMRATVAVRSGARMMRPVQESKSERGAALAARRRVSIGGLRPAQVSTRRR